MPLGVLRDIRKMYHGLNAGGIRDDAARELNIGLVATSDEVFRDMEDFLAPPDLEPRLRGRALGMIQRLDQPRKDFNLLLCEPGIGLPRNGYLCLLYTSDAADE